MRTRILLTSLLLITISMNLWATKKKSISFKSGNITLHGTLYIPSGDGPFPAVVFVHGSGPETRKNSSYSARWLTKIGYAALIYDKRGTGKSEGGKDEWNRFSFEDLANDAAAAVDFLSQTEGIDKGKIGLHASSQGGWVAPLAASKTNLINFMIMRSVSVTTVEDDRVFERGERLKKEGFTSEQISEAREMQLTEAKTTSTREDNFSRLFEANKGKTWFSRVYGGSSPFTEALTNYRKWYGTISKFDPLPLLKKSDIPVFWIFGDPKLDNKGPVTQSVSNVENLQKSGKAYKLIQLDAVGHNIPEKHYERPLFEWLNQVNDYRGSKFKKH